MSEDRLLSVTESICPECFARIPAWRVADGDQVLLKKECPEHGPSEVPIWRGTPFFEFWQRPKTPSYPKAPFTAVEKGCPWDCGLCPEHRQHTCTALIEVTPRCNLKCAYCFADSGSNHTKDPCLDTIKGCYELLLRSGGPFNIQLSGGEPTLREDLPEIIALGRSLGFSFIQINTNGLRLAKGSHYARELKDAGATSIFLQFDGVSDTTYEHLRGRALSIEKRLAVEHCAEHGLGVVLVPTLVPGINMHEIGAIIRFAMEHMPSVRGVHFQPVSYFGRYPAAPSNDIRLTIPEVIREIESLTEGMLKQQHFHPPGCENALCSFHGNFVLLPNGKLDAWRSYDQQRRNSEAEIAEVGAAKARHFVSRFWTQPPRVDRSGDDTSFDGWEEIIELIRTQTLCISGMAFQDAWNLDLDRLRDCCIHVVDLANGLVPFCAYNLTDSGGRSIYRSRGRSENV